MRARLSHRRRPPKGLEIVRRGRLLSRSGTGGRRRVASRNRKGGRMEASSAPAPGPVTGGGVTGSTELARNALGLPAVLFCIVTGSAPLAAMMFNDPLSGYGIGIGVPAAFWLATIAFTLFSVAYIEMARRVTTAGGIYSYMSYGFGRVIGLGAAICDRRRLHALRRRGQRCDVVLRPDEHPQPVRRLRHGLAHLRLLLHRADVHRHVLPRRGRSRRSSASAWSARSSS